MLGFDLKRASATSLVVIAITAVAGSIGFAFHGGVVWSAAIALGVGSTVGSYVGARLLKYIPSVYLMWGFAFLPVFLAVRLIFNAGASGSGDVSSSWPALVGMGGLGLGVIGLAALQFRRHQTTILPREAPAALIQTGLYRVSRNPIYLGDALVLAGYALWRDPAGLIWVPVLALVLWQRFIAGDAKVLIMSLRSAEGVTPLTLSPSMSKRDW